LSISIEDAFKVLISGGIVSPNSTAQVLSLPRSYKKVPETELI
jgi:uncharacterized membrane protein